MDKQWLIKQGFEPCTYKNSCGEHPYKYRFNVYRNNYDMHIDCEIVWSSDNNFSIDIYDASFGKAKYAPWYVGEDTEIVRTIKKRVDKKVKELRLYEDAFE